MHPVACSSVDRGRASANSTVSHAGDACARSVPAILMRHKRARSDDADTDDERQRVMVASCGRASTRHQHRHQPRHHPPDVHMTQTLPATQSSVNSRGADRWGDGMTGVSPPHTPVARTSAECVPSRDDVTPRSRWRRRLYTSRRDASDSVRGAVDGERGPGRVPPLPYLPWTEAQHIWASMKRKELSYVRSAEPMLRHPSLRPHMRAILVDWMVEVCEVHQLHRETFYLSVEFLDRYLSRTKNLPKSQLQLAGITCLLIAAKLEEIYPPKLSDFCYVTDGACSEEDIIDKELVIMEVLCWDLAPTTPQHWLATYLQLSDMPAFSLDVPVSPETFVARRFSTLQFVRMCQLLDLCVLDAGWLHYKYGVLAAAVYCHFTGDLGGAVLVSGYAWSELSGCVAWMKPFFETVQRHSVTHVPNFDKISTADQHNIQVHSVNLQTLDEAQQRCSEQSHSVFSSPSTCTSLCGGGGGGSQEQNSSQVHATGGHSLPTPPDSGGVRARR